MLGPKNIDATCKRQVLLLHIYDLDRQVEGSVSTKGELTSLECSKLLAEALGQKLPQNNQDVTCGNNTPYSVDKQARAKSPCMP